MIRIFGLSGKEIRVLTFRVSALCDIADEELTLETSAIGSF